MFVLPDDLWVLVVAVHMEVMLGVLLGQPCELARKLTLQHLWRYVSKPWPYWGHVEACPHLVGHVQLLQDTHHHKGGLYVGLGSLQSLPAAQGSAFFSVSTEVGDLRIHSTISGSKTNHVHLLPFRLMILDHLKNLSILVRTPSY